MGTIVEATIRGIEETRVFVECSDGVTGYISRSEFAEPIEEGDTVEIYSDQSSEDESKNFLSRRKVEKHRCFNRVVAIYKNDKTITGEVLHDVKGGMTVQLLGCLKAFLPGSEIDTSPVFDFDAYLGKQMEFRVLGANRANENIIVSHKALFEDEINEQRKNIFDSIEIGQVLKGRVTNIVDFGAFVDIGGVQGLLHRTDMSWGRISNPHEVVEVGQEIEVAILDYEKERERISLDLKQLQPDPWEDVIEKYEEGEVVEGKVVLLKEYGAFVELEEGIEGLVHTSEMSWERRTEHSSQEVSLEQVIRVKILTIDEERRRIAFSMRELKASPWDDIGERYAEGDQLTRTIKTIIHYGLFVEIESGVDGLVHISDLAWPKNVSHPGDVFDEGEKIEVVILNIDEDRRRISLGHKQVETNLWDHFESAYSEGTDTQGEVVRVKDKGLVVELPLNVQAFVPSNKLKNGPHDFQNHYSEGDDLELSVIRFHREKKDIVLRESELISKSDSSGEWGTNQQLARALEAALSASTDESETGGKGNSEERQTSNNPEPSLAELSETLARVSRSERQYAFKTFRRIASGASKLRESLIKLEDQIRQQRIATQESLEAVRPIRVEVPTKARVETERLRKFLNRRKKSDDTFSVCLFGRTNAGKSTLREAITGGDGRTIGQGEQRTTREVTTYDWNGIQLLDTPGLAAFDGSDDESTAWKAIDRTDLVLFMITSDSFQMSESDQFLWLRDRNKPVLFVMNVKHDVDNPARRKIFLKRGADTVSLEAQDEHVKEIRGRLEKYLGYSNAQIVPIHARAAYLSKNEETITQQEALWQASRVENLLEAVKEVASTHGKNYRIQAYRDELIHTLRRLRDELNQQVNALSERLSHDKSEQDKLETWFDDFEDRSIDRITSRLQNVFEKKLYSEVDSFVEKYAGEKGADRKFKRKIQKLDIASSVKEIIQPIAAEAKNKIEEHVRQSDFNEEALGLDFDTSIADLKRGYAGEMMDVAAAIADILAFFTAGMTKFAGLVIRGAKWLFSVDDGKKHREKKKQAKHRLKRKIKKKHQKMRRELTNWFDKNIADSFKTNVKEGTRSVLRAQQQALNEVKNYQAKVEKTMVSVQKEFMQRLIRVHDVVESEAISVNRVAREQGQASKLLVKGATASQVEALSTLSKSLGESVDVVQANIPIRKQVQQTVASAGPENIRKRGDKWVITLSAEGAKETTEKARMVHAQLASDLLQTSVTLVEASDA